MLKKLAIIAWGEFISLVRFFVVYFPTPYLGAFLRRKYYGAVFKENIGKNARIGRGAQIYNGAPMHIGDELNTGPDVVINPDQSFGIIIGNYVSIAHGAFIRGGNHSYYSLEKPIQHQGRVAKKLLTENGQAASIIIEDDVLIGAYAVVLSGARIGKGSVIAPGSVIVSEIPPYSIVAGNPGRAFANRKQINFSKGYEPFM